MGALNPLFLVAAVSVGVPLFLHLFQRQQVRRLSFPALRYLERTEREHARRIRMRQLLLLLLRVAVLVVLVAAGARLFLRGRGAAHPPTAVVIVLDNSMSSGLVVGEERVLDGLKDRALETLALANADDRIWVLRAGEPWTPVAPVTPAEARRLVEDTEPTDARGDLTGALDRARDLLATAPLSAREIHLVSDRQATAFDPGRSAPAEDVPVVVWAPDDTPPPNHGLRRVLVGGGLPPLQGERTQITVEATAGMDGDTTRLPVRIVVDDRIRGAASVPVGAAASVPLPPIQGGWVTGWAETDPDALRADDRRAFAFRARPAPGVSVVGDPGRFVDEAAGVLDAAGRIALVPAAAATLVLAAEGEGLDARAGRATLVTPPDDPARLPALNRRLAAAGVPWAYARGPGPGRAPVEGTRLPEPLEGIEAASWYRLTLEGEPAAPPRVLAEVAGAPWLVEGSDGSGRRYLLLASPLDPSASTLPVSASMVRFLDWAAGEWASEGGSLAERVAGRPLDAPRGATSVRLPDGTEVELDGTRMVRTTGTAGFYTFLAGDSVVSVAAVNPDPAESDLAPLPRRGLPAALSRDIVVVDRAGAWDRAVFRQRQGPELWWPLLALAVALLLAESWVAAAGRGGARARERTPTVEGHAGA